MYVWVVTVEQYFANFFTVKGVFDNERAALKCKEEHPHAKVYTMQIAS